MRYWYGYTGETLIMGHGRAIRNLMDARGLQRIFELADEQYANYASARHVQIVPKETFFAAMLAPLAVLELRIGNPPATSFSSAGQVLRLFAGLNIEQVAINLFNGKIASAYADSGDKDSIAVRVAQGFDDGNLLFIPRDTARLHTQETLNTLPGAVAFLLSRTQAERKAFSHYLRRGVPPVMSTEAKIILEKSRPVLRTWEREARLAYKDSAV